MIRDVTEFRRAEVGCPWVDELETPVRAPGGPRDALPAAGTARGPAPSPPRRPPPTPLATESSG